MCRPAAPAVRPQKVAVYARVSSAENRKNLESQAERVSAFCAARGWQVAKVVKECGSGVNDQRPQFLALLADTSISHIVVEHKDRCSRFGVAYIQTLLATQGRELVIVNEAEEGQEDVMQDFVAIITSFSPGSMAAGEPAARRRRCSPCYRRASCENHPCRSIISRSGFAILANSPNWMPWLLSIWRWCSST